MIKKQVIVLFIAATMLGVAQRAFDDTLAYVRERKQFGRPIGSFQVLRHRIADLATELECCRLLTYDPYASDDLAQKIVDLADV